MPMRVPVRVCKAYACTVHTTHKAHNTQYFTTCAQYYIRFTVKREMLDPPPLLHQTPHPDTKTRCGVYGDDLDAPANPGPRARPRRGLIAAPPARCWPPQSSGLCPGAPTGDRCYSSRAIISSLYRAGRAARCAALHAAASESLSSTLINTSPVNYWEITNPIQRWPPPRPMAIKHKNTMK